MSIIQGNAHTSTGGYQVQRSLRFNSADSAYLNRTPASAGSRTTWTWSGWVKRASLGTSQYILQARISDNANDTDKVTFRFTVNSTLALSSQVTTFRETTAVYRDTSAWYHVVLTADTSNATANNRFRIYVNGVEQVFSTTNNPTSGLTTAVNSANAHWIGSEQGVASYLSAYLTEINLIDGQALTPSSFGETDSNTGVWKPKAYTGTYGTNGFYLKFADNSGTTSTTLGKDSSSNGNNWTPNNFSVTAGAGNDSLVDSPTAYGTDTGVGGSVRGNYATMNPLDSKNGTVSNGNLLWTATASQSDIRGTFAIPASGKYYLECTVGSNTSASSAVSFGLATSSVALDASNAVTGLYQLYASSSGFLSLNGSNVSSSLGTWTSGDVLQIAVDADNTKMWLGKNNTWYDSSGGTTGNPSTGANATSTTSMVGLFPFSNCYQNNATWNAGQRAFAYTAPSGFKALCTTNLPTPTIGATSTTLANDYFDVKTWSGNSSTQSIALEFAPGLIWNKSRSGAAGHAWWDVVRGTGAQISSSETNAESTGYNAITSFSNNAISLGADNTGTSNGRTNETGRTYVGWVWNAGGSNATNTSGTITSTVRANTTAGFSIVTYTGTGSAATIGHGLGVAPSMIIVKNRQAANSWAVYHISTGANQQLLLNSINGISSDTQGFTAVPSSTVFSVGTGASMDTNQTSGGGQHVAYCFAPVAGYSAFGSYTGNGSTDGPFVYLGFRPEFVMIKRTSAADNWVILDAVRSTANPTDEYLWANLSNAEVANLHAFDFLSNGFKIRNSTSDHNTNGSTYIYACFAESPFKYSLAR